MSTPTAPGPGDPRCLRRAAGHPDDCPGYYGMMNVESWYHICQTEYDQWCDEQAEEARRQASLEGQPWPEDEPPAWSYRQITEPSAN